ncbi:MAG TPA: 6-pyruvoyl tetrahydropterin synthase family protein [Thermoguttaceae bacterium]|nr:6-pyruvoyl tetrahydropterin synthase family protein [Thermoguttaceae bacterium]
MESYGVRIAKANLTFSAAHFITLHAKQCEQLHGHNYRVGVEVEGPLGDSQFVVDFVTLERLLRAFVEPLDHRVLLPTDHPTIQIFESDTQIEAIWKQRRWVFPRSDTVLLPVSNTTAELLACHIGRQLIKALRDTAGFEPRSLRVELQEIDGHSAFFTWRTD